MSVRITAPQLVNSSACEEGIIAFCDAVGGSYAFDPEVESLIVESATGEFTADEWGPERQVGVLLHPELRRYWGWAVEHGLISAWSMAGTDLSRVDLRGADLSGANLREADLTETNLHGADLRGVNLRGADLCGADLRGADLRGADLRRANLTGAYLSGADLTWANLRGADLGGWERDPETGFMRPT